MRIYRHATREGTRGVRVFAHVDLDATKGHALEGRFEGYVASGARHTGIGLSTDDDSSGLQVFAGLGHVANGWLTVGSWAVMGAIYRRWKKALPELDIINVRVHDGAVWWSLWHPKHEWHSSTPRWRNGHFNLADWALGRHQFSKTVVEGPTRVLVPMPERSYPATVTIELRRWKRPRWPWAREEYGYDLDLLKEDGSPGYIPTPGKGENSWDCGGDGTFGKSGPGRTIEAAIAGVVQSTLADRRRRGARADYAEPIS